MLVAAPLYFGYARRHLGGLHVLSSLPKYNGRKRSWLGNGRVPRDRVYAACGMRISRDGVGVINDGDQADPPWSVDGTPLPRILPIMTAICPDCEQALVPGALEEVRALITKLVPAAFGGVTDRHDLVGAYVREALARPLPPGVIRATVPR